MGKRGMGDFTSQLYQLTDRPQGIASPQGKVVGPTFSPEEDMGERQETLDYIRLLWHEMRRQMIDNFPREGEPFIKSQGEVNVANNATATAATFTVPDGSTGKLTKIEVYVPNPAQYPNIQWSLLAAGQIVPGLSQYVASPGTASITDFPLELVSGTTYVLQAFNNGAGVAINVAGRIQGWTELLIGWKDFGKTPAAGV